MQMYTFKLKIEKEKFPPEADQSLAERLALLRDGKAIASVEWPDGRDMGKRLFEAIAELLETNNLKPEQVSDFVVDSAIPEYCTSARIAETVKRMYVFGVKNLQ